MYNMPGVLLSLCSPFVRQIWTSADLEGSQLRDELFTNQSNIILHNDVVVVVTSHSQV